MPGERQLAADERGFTPIKTDSHEKGLKRTKPDQYHRPPLLFLCLFAARYLFIRVYLRSSAAYFLLFRRRLSSCLITSAAAPDSIQRFIRLQLIGDESTARAADADRDVVAALDAHAVCVVAPNKAIEIAGRLNGQVRLSIVSG